MRKPSLRVRSTLVVKVVLLVAAVVGTLQWNPDFFNARVSAQPTVAVLNAASFDSSRALAPDAIGAAFGPFVTINNTSYQATLPLPTTLGGVSVKVGGLDAQLFFVGPTQINFLAPSALPDNPNTSIVVTNSNGTTLAGSFVVFRAAPGIFTALSNGIGGAAAVTTFDGVSFPAVTSGNGTLLDVDPGTSQRQNRLILFATGVRNSPAGTVRVDIQGVQCTVEFVGAAPGFFGLDQLNVVLPPELGGAGVLNVTVTANTIRSNNAQIKIAGSAPPVRATPLAFGQILNGELAPSDQIQISRDNNGVATTFFFDAYSFETTAANTSVAVDMRATPAQAFDPAVLLYRIDSVGGVDTLNFLGADDQSGGYGNGSIDNNNALLFTVLANPGRYVVFASSSDLNPNGVGQYTINLAQNVITPIAYGQAVAGPAITASDLQTSAGTYLDLYSFTGTQGDRIQIQMGSTVLDSFLILQGNAGDPPLVADDNGGGGTNALIDPTHGVVPGSDPPVFLPSLPATGTYIIIATPFAPNQTGAYTFSLTRQGGFDTANLTLPGVLTPGRSLTDFRLKQTGERRSSFQRFGTRRIAPSLQ
jgi:uncharacterized protein (TIGR03437 family)